MTITAVLSLLLVLSLSLICTRFTRHRVDEMRQATEQIVLTMRAEDWEGALGQIHRMARQWEQESDLLALWSHHGDLETIRIALARLQASVEEGERFSSLLYAAELTDALELMDERDVLSLKNIF